MEKGFKNYSVGNEGLIRAWVSSWNSAVGFFFMPMGCLGYFSLYSGFYSSQDCSLSEYRVKSTFLVPLSLKQVYSPTEVFCLFVLFWVYIPSNQELNKKYKGFLLYIHAASFGLQVCSVMSDSLWPCGLGSARFLCPWDFPGKNTGTHCHLLLQQIFLIQGSNPSLLYCRQILYHLSYQGSPFYTVPFHFDPCRKKDQGLWINKRWKKRIYLDLDKKKIY